MKTLSLFAFAALLAFSSSAQLSTKTSVSLNLSSMAIDDARYDEINKSPYLFAEFVDAKVYDKKKDKTDNYKINYNGYSKSFEFLHNDEKFELDVTHYDMIEVASYTPNEVYASKFASEGPLKFVKGLDAKDRKNFQMLLYADAETTIYKKFEAKITERESTDNGTQIVKSQFFSPFFYYYKEEGGKREQVRLNKKKILASMNNESVNSFAKKNKLKLNNESDFKKVLAHYGDVTLVDKPGADVAANTNN